jgi:DNA polymerase I-like protein with 3'-5' exonuclease and polymerase domains
MLFADLQTQRRPPKDLPVLDTGSRWTPPAQLPSLKGVKRLGFDTETKDRDLEAMGPGFKRTGDSKAHVVGFSLALDLDGPRMYVPVRHQGGGNLDEGIVKRWCVKELEEFDGELVGAALAYDLKAMRSPQFGINFSKVKKFCDVLVAEPILDEWRRKYDLDSVLKTHLGEGKAYGHVYRVMERYGYKSVKEFKKNLWRHPAWDTGEYAEGDVAELLRCLDVQLAQMDLEDREEGVHLRDVFDLECDLVPILVEMWDRGVRVDLQRVEEIERDLEAERRKWLTELKRIAGSKAELMAPESFIGAIREAGLEPPLTAHKTDPKPSVTKEWLAAHRGVPVVDAIIGGRRVDYIFNTFLKGHIHTHSVNGRIHPTFRQLKGEKTDTGEASGGDDSDQSGTVARFACQTPNLQNIPARDPYLGPLIRSMYVPEEGEDWRSDDLAQIEYRYLVHYAIGRGAEAARRKYNEDHKTDFHVFGGDLLGVDANDEFIRKRVKNTGFCKVYGGGDGKLAITFGCSFEEAVKFSKKYDEELPFVNETAKKATEWALKRGFVVDILGRKQRFPFWERKRKRKDSEGRIIYEPPLSYEEALEVYARIERVDRRTGELTISEPNPHLIQRAWGHKVLNRKLQASAASHMKKWMIKAVKDGVHRVLGPMLITVHDEGNNSVPRTAEGREAAEHFRRCGETCIEGLRVPIQIKAKYGPNWGTCK